MITLPQVPVGYDEILKLYGNPDVDHDIILDANWFSTHIRVFDLPFAMRYFVNEDSWVPVRRFQAHFLVGEAMVDALAEVYRVVGLEEMQDREWDRFAGCFNFRANRRSPRLSTHAWGIAIDLNPHLAPMGQRICGQPQPIKTAFETRGFYCVPSDFQHFQACTGW